MTDDQQMTSDLSAPSNDSGLSSLKTSQEQVNSEQQKKTVHSPLPTAHPEPNYQDELDVYEAVAKLEKKYGKKFLTDEQRKMI